MNIIEIFLNLGTYLVLGESWMDKPTDFGVPMGVLFLLAFMGMMFGNANRQKQQIDHQQQQIAEFRKTQKQENKKKVTTLQSATVSAELAQLSDVGAPGLPVVRMHDFRKPGMIATGSVTFSDGVKCEWHVDQFYRLALVPPSEGYRPLEGGHD